MNYNNILFLDIETVSQFETYNHLPEDWKELWDLKAGIINRNKEDETSESVYHRAGIYAEFGKIICISCGYIMGSGEDKKLIIRSYCGDDEKNCCANSQKCCSTGAATWKNISAPIMERNLTTLTSAGV
jgi:hypothetical protein